MTSLLTWREKKALGNLRHMPWENVSQLYVGKGTIASLLSNGWVIPIEGGGQQRRLKITEAGIEVYDKSIATKPENRPQRDEGEWY